MNGDTELLDIIELREELEDTQKELAELREKYDALVKHFGVLCITHPHLCPAEWQPVTIEYIEPEVYSNE